MAWPGPSAADDPLSDFTKAAISQICASENLRAQDGMPFGRPWTILA